MIEPAIPPGTKVVAIAQHAGFGGGRRYTKAQVVRETKTRVFVEGCAEGFERKEGYKVGSNKRYTSARIEVWTAKHEEALLVTELEARIWGLRKRAERAFKQSIERLERSVTPAMRSRGDKAAFALENALIALERAFDVTSPE